MNYDLLGAADPRLLQCRWRPCRSRGTSAWASPTAVLPLTHHRLFPTRASHSPIRTATRPVSGRTRRPDRRRCETPQILRRARHSQLATSAERLDTAPKASHMPPPSGRRRTGAARVRDLPAANAESHLSPAQPSGTCGYRAHRAPHAPDLIVPAAANLRPSLVMSVTRGHADAPSHRGGVGRRLRAAISSLTHQAQRPRALSSAPRALASDRAPPSGRPRASPGDQVLGASGEAVSVQLHRHLAQRDSVSPLSRPRAIAELHGSFNQLSPRNALRLRPPRSSAFFGQARLTVIPGFRSRHGTAGRCRPA